MGKSRLRISSISILLMLPLVLAFALVESAFAANTDYITAGDAEGLHSTASPKDLFFDAHPTYEGSERFNCYAAVYGLESGAATYDKNTRTLTLNNVKAKSVELGSLHVVAPTTTIKLTGANSLSEGINGDECRGLVINGPGSLTIKNADHGITLGDYGSNQTQSLTINSGTVNIIAPSYTGISITSGNLIVRGGNLNVTGAHSTAISVSSREYRSKTYGGVVSLVGGKLVAETTKPSTSTAIYATKMTNKISCLKSIKGALPKGASFKVSGNEYKLGTKNYSYGATFSKYGSKSTKAVVKDAIKYGSYKYYVYAIGAKAFNTKKGKKVKTITVNADIREIGANAFKGTKALTNIKFKWLPFSNYKYTKKGALKSIKWAADSSINKKAFAGCGKAGGKKLKVTLHAGNSFKGVYYKDVAVYKKALVSKGLPKKVSLKTWK